MHSSESGMALPYDFHWLICRREEGYTELYRIFTGKETQRGVLSTLLKLLPTFFQPHPNKHLLVQSQQYKQ